MTKIIDHSDEPALNFRERLHEQARKNIWEALDRLSSGNPTKVKPGTRITAKSVAAEAGVDRATLYRSHSVVLDHIRQIPTHHSGKVSKPLPTNRHSEEKRLSEYRSLAEEAQRQVTMLARHQYKLDALIEELSKALALKDLIIRDLNERLTKLSTDRRIHSIK